jgi:putative hydrolase of the HAD superfamily
MNHLTAILFDFGGTILGDRRYDPEGGYARLLDYAILPNTLTLKEVQEEAHRLDSELEKHYGLIEFPVQKFQRTLFDKLGIQFQISFSEMELEFWKGAVRYSPEPGIIEALDELTRLKIKMGIVSNYPFSGSVLGWELQRHGLKDAFSFVLSSADYAIRKPHPLLFEVAIAKLNIRADQAWYCGNSPEYDIKGARSAGLWSIWYNRQRSTSDGTRPDAEVHNWSEFIPIVRSHLK